MSCYVLLMLQPGPSCPHSRKVPCELKASRAHCVSLEYCNFNRHFYNPYQRAGVWAKVEDKHEYWVVSIGPLHSHVYCSLSDLMHIKLLWTPKIFLSCWWGLTQFWWPVPKDALWLANGQTPRLIFCHHTNNTKSSHKQDLHTL